MLPETLAPAVTEFLYAPFLNYALQQAHVPLVRRLKIKNNTENDWHDVRISIALAPDFAEAFEYRAETISAGNALELEAIKMPVRSAALAELTERMDGELHLKGRAGDETLFEERHTVAILPYDHWQGVSLLPEGIAAFITPNHPQIPAIIRRASEILAGWTGSPSFDEYQTRNPNRVRKQMAALYEAIAELQIVYCSVPASFEESGQRVRLADALLAQRMGNCLDMSLLYAACLEAVGIRPLIVIVHGHAFAGGWLIDESFADAVNDDPSLLTKRMASGINEIALVESTCMNSGPATHFDDAVRAAEARLADTDAFVLFVDVKRARFSRIRPLPLRIAAGGGFQLVEEAPQITRTADVPLELGQTVTVIDGKPVAVGKQQLWERKLLDLTLRNNLLNLRLTKGSIQFIHINAARLEDALSGGAEFQVLPRPTDWDLPERAAGLFGTLTSADPMAELFESELTQKRLRSYLSETELTANLTAIYRASRTALEENGASTLYIALGFLKWFETDASEAPRYAPILLLPVEIVRKSARVGFVIRSREEEPMLNITLLEKLRQDFGIAIGGLDTLPRDESGVDVAQIFNIIRRAVMAQSRWNVEEQIVLGTFSFNKFILWNDIHNNAAQLLQNKTVASLVSGKLEWTVTPEAPFALDDAFSPQSIALPIATDSSQLEAIISSGEGKSFVLHGPPGTGKSQTITNIIANALYAGKKVLFVAAKKAALEVVQSRLESIGIGPFCLELHSNKARKTAIIEQLKRATDISRKPSPPDFNREAERLAALRTELNDYVKSLHRSWPFGLSLYEAFSRWSAEETAVPDSISIPPSILATLTAADVENWTEAVRELAIAGRAVGIPEHHPLRGTAPQSYSPTLRPEAAEALKQFIDALHALEAALPEAEKALSVSGIGKTAAQTEAASALATALLALPDVPVAMLDPAVAGPEQTFGPLKSWTALGRSRDAQKAAVLQNFGAGVLNLNAPQLLADWNIAAGKWFLPKWLGQRKVAKTVLAYAQGSVDKSTLPQILQNLVDYGEAAGKISGNKAAQRLAGFLYRDDEADWDAIDNAADAVIALNGAALRLTGPAALKDWRERFAAAAGEGTGAFISGNNAVLSGFVKRLSEAKQRQSAVAALLHTTGAEAGDDSWIQKETDRATRWLANLDGLKDWSTWIALSQKASAMRMESVTAAFEQGAIPPALLEPSFRKSFYRSAADYILGQSPQLAQFNAALFEEKILRFKALSERFETLTREELYARLAARVPDFSVEASQSSEVGILQKAIRSNGRAMSIRRLFDTVPNLLPRLTPCMLMSPISVAQYFDAASPKFDIVIFDEASQLPTCEAVGAIARGTTLIVVGDPKQMPPTSFFATAQVDEDNLEQEDLESILDDCLALSMPSRHLLWHYRSKHESLIAFSNAKYYDNSLLTFPSTDDLATKVRYVHVPGFYDKGKTRQNKAEAVAIVAEIIRRLGDPQLSRRSMGVVTFSVVQQNLIEDLLTEEFRKNPQIEKAALESAEPLFIKNLENVQGDERDVILFSVCYGPDEAGKVSLNFGPLNREGGWRRLNVAVSRARYEMLVFATLRADGIDLSRTAAEGVAGLRDFLSFAEKGKAALPVKAAMSAPPTDNLVSSLAAAIREKGYEVHLNIGCSGYRLDAAVVHPEKPHEYLLGILCDGPSYNAARTARDREVVQQSVLRGLGWKLHRVWSLDWWENREKVLAAIEEAIAEALQPPPQGPGLPADAEFPEISGREDGVRLEEGKAPVLKKAEAPLAGFAAQAVGNGVGVVQTAVASQELNQGIATPYVVCALPPVTDATSESFLEPRHRRRIREQIAEVLKAEAPISKALLYRRVLGAWSIGRAGARITSQIDGLLQDMDIRQITHGRRSFLWRTDQQPSHYNTYRLAANEAQKRDADDLPPEEVAACVKALLEQQLSLPRAALIREAARVMGYTRLGSKVEEAFVAGVDWAVANGKVRVDGERVVAG